MKNCVPCKVVRALACIGALNWGLVALFGIDLVVKVFGGVSSPAGKVVYILIGIAGLLGLIGMFMTPPCCKKTDAS